MQSYENRLWQVRETPFRRCDQPHMETIFTIGNGLVGVRGTFEEGYPGDASTTLVAGVFNHKEGALVPELVSMPNWLSLTVHIDGEPFSLDTGKILGYDRVLDMKTATLRRGVLWLSPSGTVLRLAFERFASLSNPHVLGLRLLIQVLAGGYSTESRHTIRITSALDGTVLNPGAVDHWRQVAIANDQDRLQFIGETEQSGYGVAMRAHLTVSGAAGVNWTDESQSRCPAHAASFEMDIDQQVTITKLVSLHTTRDSADPAQASAGTLDAAVQQGYDALKAKHDAAWARYWEQSDIVIEGDEMAQQALRFCTYHLLIAVPTHEEQVSIGAKTLSGFGYKGHVFWDTELFMVPPLTLTQPEQARSLLMYRYHNLPGARAKALEAGYDGAMFPWESTDTGEETTPRWTEPDSRTGERIRIWTGDNEQHISSDIAYAVIQYWQWSGNDDWFVNYGAELVLDTACFWGTRAEFNAAEDRYELRMQIGPDEYHENVDNSVFTNRLVVWHLRQALEVWQWLMTHHPAAAERLGAQLGITEDRLSSWQAISDKMWINITEDGVFEQFENFFQRLKPINLPDYTPRTTNMDWILGYERTQTARVIKQADVVMLMALLGDALGDRAFLLRNWDAYYPVVDHGSSLSPAIHAWVAARLGLLEKAYDMFMYAATIDLNDNKGNVRDGIHAASCGGVWQAVIFGFCGLYLTPDGPAVKPSLPEHWRRVAFNVKYHGKTYNFEITSQ
ncbi:MAG: glycoside hydrolase family 65 protein [Chloroflexota bacterium]